MLACEQIVEQSRAQAAEVPGARRARGETHAHTCAADSHFVVSHRDTPLNTGKLSRFSLVSSPQVLCEAVTSLQLRRTAFKATPRPRTPRDSPRNMPLSWCRAFAIPTYNIPPQPQCGGDRQVCPHKTQGWKRTSFVKWSRLSAGPHATGIFVSAYCNLHYHHHIHYQRDIQAKEEPFIALSCHVEDLGYVITQARVNGLFFTQQGRSTAGTDSNYINRASVWMRRQT
jgi:hypothetical protein